MTLLKDQAPGAAGGGVSLAPADGEVGTDRGDVVRATALLSIGVLLCLGAQAVLPGPVALVLASIGGVVGSVGARKLTPAVVGTLAWYLACAGATVAVIRLADTAQNNVALALVMVIVGLGLPLLRWLQMQLGEGVGVRVAISKAGQCLAHPTTGLAAVAIGVGIAMPLIGTYAPIVPDPDSAWFVTSTQHVQENGIGLLQDTHDVFLPHLTVGPLLTLGGYQAAIAFVILNMLALSGLTAYLGYRITDSGVGAVAAAAALMNIPGIIERTDRIPMYPAAFFLAYGAAWRLHRAMAEPERHPWFPVVAGVGLVLAYEAHGVGQVFLMIPFLLLLLHPWRRARRSFALAIATVIVVSIPRVWMNFSVDGFTAFRSNYANFTIRKYLPIINRDFWEYNVDTNPLGYLTNMPGMVQEVVGSRGTLLLLLVPVAVAALQAGRRQRVFVAVTVSAFIGAVAVSSPSTFGRYLTPVVVGFALLVAVGLVGMVRLSDQGKVVGQLMVGAVLLGGFYQIVDTVSAKVDEREEIVHGPWPDLAATLDDDRAVIGVRPHQLLKTDGDIRAVNGRVMTEEDWVTYLSWPSDAEVLDMMERYDVGWVYMLPSRRFEVDYNETWLEPVYGLTVDHVDGVLNSDQFCLAGEAQGYLLFRVGECQAGDLRDVPDGIYREFYGDDLADEEAGDEDADEDGAGEAEIEGEEEVAEGDAAVGAGQRRR